MLPQSPGLPLGKYTLTAAQRALTPTEIIKDDMKSSLFSAPFPPWLARPGFSATPQFSSHPLVKAASCVYARPG